MHMKQDKMHLINKIFNNETIRTVWDAEEEKYYISVVDIVSVITESSDGRKYWNKLKQRLNEEGNETVTNCHQLKLKAQDGKYRLTDVVDIEGMFRIIESIPSKNAEPIKQWLARLGSERIDETFDPSIAIQRSIDLYRAKGYDEEWIIKRIKALQDRKKLTDVWKENGVYTETEFAILTNGIYKSFKGLRKESLRDNMTDLKILLADIGETATRELAKKHKPQGLSQNRKVAKDGGEVANNTRKDLESKLGAPIVTNQNALNYKYTDEPKQIKN